LLPWSWATERLERSRNYWIVTTRADGRAHAAPVWGLWHDGAVLFGTAPESVKGKNIARDPRAVVHLESGDEVVILEGTVGRVPVDEQIDGAYKTKYGLGLPAPEVLGLRPTRAYAWTENDYPNDATRFEWD
jgi:hypothetical protein